MEKKVITITKALSEIKLLEARIEKKVKQSSFVDIRTVKNEKLKLKPILVADFEKDVKESYQSVNDLIKERNKIKQAIVLSNAFTKVTIAEKEYTVAEAIERKNSIKLEELLLDKLKKDYNNAISRCEQYNAELEESIEEIIQQFANNTNGGKSNKEDAIKFGNARRENETTELVDPLKIKEQIDKLELEINEFKAEVDQALSISNATTVVEI